MRAASNDAARSYTCHGLEVRSDIELPGLETSGSPTGAATNDETVLVSRVDEIDTSTVDGVLIATDRLGAGRFEMRDADGVWTIRAEGINLRIHLDAQGLEVATDGSASAEAAVGWFVGGLGLSAVLIKRDVLVMHGSLVRYRERGSLFMARSGHGKSLCAAAAVSAGAGLVAEDTVRIDGSRAPRPGFSAPMGSTLLRLRRPRDEVEHMLPGRPVSLSSDGRTIVHCDAPVVRSSVDRLVFLKLDPKATEARVHDMDPMTTLQTCMGHVRVPGIVGTDVASQVFDQLGGLIDALPGQLFHLPWNGDTTRLVADVAACLEEN